MSMYSIYNNYVLGKENARRKACVFHYAGTEVAKFPLHINDVIIQVP